MLKFKITFKLDFYTNTGHRKGIKEKKSPNTHSGPWASQFSAAVHGPLWCMMRGEIQTPEFRTLFLTTGR